MIIQKAVIYVCMLTVTVFNYIDSQMFYCLYPSCKDKTCGRVTQSMLTLPCEIVFHHEIRITHSWEIFKGGNSMAIIWGLVMVLSAGIAIFSIKQSADLKKKKLEIAKTALEKGGGITNTGDGDFIIAGSKEVKTVERKQSVAKFFALVASIVTILSFILAFMPDVIPLFDEGMPRGRYYSHDGENFMDEIHDPLIANMMIFEFRGRRQGTQHLPMGVSVAFDYTIQGNRLLITIQGATLEYVLGDNRTSFYDSSGMIRFVRRQ